MSIETRGQWIRIGDSWLDAATVVCVERHDEDGRTLVGLSSGACADCEVEPDDVIEAVHRARRFVGADLVALPESKTSTNTARAWRAFLASDRAEVAATLRTGADRAERGGAATAGELLRTAAALLEEAGGSA